MRAPQEEFLGDAGAPFSLAPNTSSLYLPTFKFPETVRTQTRPDLWKFASAVLVLLALGQPVTSPLLKVGGPALMLIGLVSSVQSKRCSTRLASLHQTHTRKTDPN